MDLRNHGRQSTPESAERGHEKANRNNPTVASKVLVILLIIVAVLLIVVMAGRLYFFKSTVTNVKSDQYQALFLTNGQVYFGRLAQVDNSYVKLTEIYYLQVQQQVQPKDNKTPAEQPQVSLAKLGSELHGPEDTMYVSRQQVLFWENLKNDGKVAKAIKDYQANPK